MRRLSILILICLVLASCSWLRVRKWDIQQGNVVSKEQLAKIHRGMTETQVKGIMGNPVLENTFDDNRIDYVYTFKPGYGEVTEKNITLRFRNERLTDIESDFNGTTSKNHFYNFVGWIRPPGRNPPKICTYFLVDYGLAA